MQRRVLLQERVWREGVLGLQVLPDAFDTALAAEAGHLPTTKRRGTIGHHTHVQPQHPRLQGLDEALPAS